MSTILLRLGAYSRLAVLDANSPDRAANELIEALGRRLREHRVNARLTMREVAARSGVSQPFLSQLERGHASPSLTTLIALAHVYDTTPEQLLAEGQTSSVRLTRAGDGREYDVTDAAGSAVRRVLLDGWPLTASEYVVEPGADLGGFYDSRGVELIHMITGRLSVELADDEVRELRAGDSVQYPSAIPHRWRQLGSETTRFLHVIVTTR